MIDPDQFEFANALTLNEANALSGALNEALTAMAHHGSNTGAMQMIATLHLIAKRECAAAFKTSGMLKAPRRAE